MVPYESARVTSCLRGSCVVALHGGRPQTSRPGRTEEGTLETRTVTDRAPSPNYSQATSLPRLDRSPVGVRTTRGTEGPRPRGRTRLPRRDGIRSRDGTGHTESSAPVGARPGLRTWGRNEDPLLKRTKSTCECGTVSDPEWTC